LSLCGDSARPLFVGHLAGACRFFAFRSLRIMRSPITFRDRAHGHADELPGPASERIKFRRE
jgi:hypothetical protein